MNMYSRLGATVVTSTILMFGLMYLNTHQIDHPFFGQMRTHIWH